MGDKVTVRYTGRFQDGRKFDGSDEGDDLVFIVGSGDVIPGFSQAVIRMKPGDDKKVRISPENAYGARDNHLERSVLLNSLPENTSVNDQVRIEFKGVKMVGRVVGIENGTARVDANHPLAGRILFFHIRLVSIEPAGRGSTGA